MASGGARTRSGPPPDPSALRRDRDAGEWTVLPAAGSDGATPDWPLVEQTDREATLWNGLWEKPQALMWARYGLELEVALYVRRLTEAELPNAFVGLSTTVRQLADSLGLTVPGMRANRWRIAVEDDAPAPAAAGRAASSARNRLTVITGDGAG